jgi:hypothetical protein
MSAQTNGVSDAIGEDARIVLRLVGTHVRLQFTTADVLAMHPRHPEARPRGEVEPGAQAGQEARRGCVAMSEGEVTSALQELSQARGWLGSFAPGRYVFRAFQAGLAMDPCNPDEPGPMPSPGRREDPAELDRQAAEEANRAENEGYALGRPGVPGSAPVLMQP